MIVSLDMHEMNAIKWIDAENGLVPLLPLALSRSCLSTVHGHTTSHAPGERMTSLSSFQSRTCFGLLCADRHRVRASHW